MPLKFHARLNVKKDHLHESLTPPRGRGLLWEEWNRGPRIGGNNGTNQMQETNDQVAREDLGCGPRAHGSPVRPKNGDLTHLLRPRLDESTPGRDISVSPDSRSHVGWVDSGLGRFRLTRPLTPSRTSPLQVRRLPFRPTPDPAWRGGWTIRRYLQQELTKSKAR